MRTTILAVEFDASLRIPIVVKDKYGVIHDFWDKVSGIAVTVPKEISSYTSEDEIINDCFNIIYDVYGREFFRSLNKLTFLF